MILTYLPARPLNAALVSLPLQTAAADDESYWSTLLPGAAEKHEREAAARLAPVILAPRQRKQVDYTGKLGGKVAAPQQQFVSRWKWPLRFVRWPLTAHSTQPNGNCEPLRSRERMGRCSSSKRPARFLRRGANWQPMLW